MRQKISVLLVAGLIAGTLVGCGNKKANAVTVPVQTVSSLMGYDLSGNNRFAGVVESKATQSIQKEDDREVLDIRVKVGDEVKVGDVLFCYDQESLEISVEEAELELEQLNSSIKAYQNTITELNKQLKGTKGDERLRISMDLQQTQIDLAEANYNLKKKQKDVDNLKKELGNVEVKAEVDGVVQSIATAGESDDSNAFMTILQTGVLQVKGQATETSISSIYEGQPVVVRSRTDSTKTWVGNISVINTDGDSTSDSDSNGYSYSSDDNSGNQASRYSFNVTLESSEGLLMGQHVYIEQSTTGMEGIVLNAGYTVKSADDTAYVWVSKQDKLEKREVTLGEYNESDDTWQVTSGLSAEDGIAYPENDLQEGQAVTWFDNSKTNEDDIQDATDGGDYDSSTYYDEGYYDSSAYYDEGYYDGSAYYGEGEVTESVEDAEQ